MILLMMQNTAVDFIIWAGIAMDCKDRHILREQSNFKGDEETEVGLP